MKQKQLRDHFLEEVKAGRVHPAYRHLSEQAQALILQLEDETAVGILNRMLDMTDEQIDAFPEESVAGLYSPEPNNAEMEKLTQELLNAGFIKPAWHEGTRPVYYHQVESNRLARRMAQVLDEQLPRARAH